ncbi:hypothetical protein EDB89DRAFT_2071081 [Lactarius sanguifluus]|nr:hypothetical protein EDB89DRAFT_2071081 [Lactarius sanguifluus]
MVPPLLHIIAVAIGLFVLLLPVQAYIPMVPTNDTNEAIADGLNVTDISRVYLQWYNVVGRLRCQDISPVSYWTRVLTPYFSVPVSPAKTSRRYQYQLVGNGSNGISKGALVRFSEEDARDVANDTTTTPWIALVSCDTNATHASDFYDIFTLANDRGAIGALLYSEWSRACIINPEYTDPTSFNPLMDIFSTQSLASARVILGQLEVINTNVYGEYNPATLNASQAAINDTLVAGYPTAPGYLWATLAAYNATAPLGINNSAGNPQTQSGGGTGSSKTTLAMIILYAITGCIAGLFAVVIITGVIRAVRHPERYRAASGSGDVGGPGRGGVLTRAILDTFPLVKFGARRAEAESQMEAKDHDIEAYGSRPSTLEMRDIQNDVSATSSAGPEHTRTATVSDADAEDDAARPHSHVHDDDHDPELADLPPARPRAGPSRSAEPPRATSVADPLPESIGRETCPICIVDFDDGDDVRVLPCEGKHVFHQACVDPWLLELSSSCPICRHDFQALETMLAGGEPTERRASQPPRFSRYLHFARRRHRHRMEEQDPTDPPLALAPGQGQEH